AVVARSLSQPARAATPGAAGGMPVIAAPTGLDPSANYTAAWKQVIATANQVGRTQAFRAMQDSAEQAAPHDGLGIVGFAGVAAGAILMRDALPVEKVLLLYEPFAAAFPYENLAQAVLIPAAFSRPSSSTAVSRILNFWTLPVTVIGNASTNFQWRGSL